MQNNRFFVFGIALVAFVLLISSFAFAASNQTIVVGSVYDYSFYNSDTDSYAHDVSLIVKCDGESQTVTSKTSVGSDGHGYYSALFDAAKCPENSTVFVSAGSGWDITVSKENGVVLSCVKNPNSLYCGSSSDFLITNVAVVDLGAKQKATTSSGGGSGKVNRTGVVNTTTNESVSELTFNPSNANPIPESNETQNDETEPTSSGITGAAVGALGLSMGQWILLVIVLAGIVGLFFFVRSRNSRLNSFY